ncbi:hypothetical protein NP493_223g02013 [Ridgeia piscesae]|uniref:Chromatin-remodeling ATPase INO80 n=1 Tax=Ridgeia piscesae TaxID=27915 RepID=A0AAD9P096_RIDPI|nr:hypothetical protein NP493_223g02013 [Ridgeia piscesae]
MCVSPSPVCSPSPVLSVPHPVCQSLSSCVSVPLPCVSVPLPCVSVPLPCVSVPLPCVSVPLPCVSVPLPCVSVPHPCVSVPSPVCVCQSLSRVCQSLSLVCQSLSRVCQSLTHVCQSLSRVCQSLSRVCRSLSHVLFCVLQGMNWLANLYDQGINGILADEMGLGKTVQSIALLGYLAEVVPYWGNTQDRKVLRKFWNPELIHTEDASFHVVVTSYQLIIQDVKYFQRIRWHYMILDEAQAIKSTSSARWKILLDFNCRNRLLLTGTPIQNTMAELWALLHFIMPTLFDSHDEFNEWFSKDIENFAEKQSGLDEDQLSRLHMILKPFMLRRVKKDVENELSDKIQILIYCPLTIRQRLLYQAVKNKISIEDLLQSSTPSNSTQAQTSTSSLMNLVMQFRKVSRCTEVRLLDSNLCSKRHLVFNRFYIHNEAHVHRSLFPQSCIDMSASVNSEFSFTRFINCSPGELMSVMLDGLLVRYSTFYAHLSICFA